MDYLVHHMLHTSARRFADKVALVHGEERLTYREVALRVKGLANGLNNAGIGPSERVGIYLEPSIAQVISIFGVSEAGAAFVPINAVLLRDQVTHIIRDCGMKGLITTRAKLTSILDSLPEMPTLEFIVLFDAELPTNLSCRVYRFEDL